MYSNPYGYPNGPGGPGFNGAPPPQNPHLQPGPSQNQQTQMMYNTQQFPMGTQPGGHFPGSANPALMGAAGPAGMMQNPAMPHMATNGQMAYQTPYTTSGYGPTVPSPAAPQPQLPGNYMMAGSMPQYHMNPGMHPQQQMMQRMHPGQPQNPAGMPGGTPQRPPFNPAQQQPGNNGMPSQQQMHFAAPQAQQRQQAQQQAQQQQQQQQQQQGTPQNQTPTSTQPPNTSVATPQTPTFPSTAQQGQANGTSSVSTPQSPATEALEKEKFAVLLEINNELLAEAVTLQNTKNELMKEQAAGSNEGGDANSSGIDYDGEQKMIQRDYLQCMRRLQMNLSCLATLADRKSKEPPNPLVTPPILNLNLKVRAPPTPVTEKPPLDPATDRAERAKVLKELYQKLQVLFPHIDPNEELANPTGIPNPNRPGMKGPNGQPAGPGGPGQAAGGQGSNHGSPAPGAQVQRTPQMENTPAPPMIQPQLAGS